MSLLDLQGMKPVREYGGGGGKSHCSRCCGGDGGSFLSLLLC
jgi:hypothetical protein